MPFLNSSHFQIHIFSYPFHPDTLKAASRKDSRQQACLAVSATKGMLRPLSKKIRLGSRNVNGCLLFAGSLNMDIYLTQGIFYHLSAGKTLSLLQFFIFRLSAHRTGAVGECPSIPPPPIAKIHSPAYRSSIPAAIARVRSLSYRPSIPPPIGLRPIGPPPFKGRTKKAPCLLPKKCRLPQCPPFEGRSQTLGASAP